MSHETESSLITQVAIVGGGIAGVRAAVALETVNIDYVLLEAHEALGGRLRRADDSFAPGIGLDVGGEVAHGLETEINRLAEIAGIKLEPFFVTSQGDGGPTDRLVNGHGGYYYYAARNETSKRLRRFDELCDDARVAHDLTQGLDEITEKRLPASLRNDSVGKYLQSYNTPPGVMALLDAGYANTCCQDSMFDLSLSNTIVFENNWSYYDHAEVDACVHDSKDAMADCLRALTDRLQWSRVRCNSPVEFIRTDANGIVHLTTKGVNGSEPKTVRARCVIIAVPLRMLQLDSIRFDPPLAAHKREAINALPIKSACKMILKYRAEPNKLPIWPLDCSSVVMADELVPEAWFHSDCVGDDGHTYHFAVAFCTARWRDRIMTEFAGDDNAACAAFDQQLRRVFGPTRASPPVASMLFDWTRDAPYVQCGYSAPVQLDRSHNFGVANQRLFAAINETEPAARRFYAGEAAAFPHAGMTLHGALCSGLAAAREVARWLHSQGKL